MKISERLATVMLEVPVSRFTPQAHIRDAGKIDMIADIIACLCFQECSALLLQVQSADLLSFVLPPSCPRQPCPYETTGYQRIEYTLEFESCTLAG
mmetsp:Transcript_10839/g.24628  ORF Transcript_10839/g.24628 Transcript_10839/m.24628 type:complete len:96 (-) Transcript_10839:103-390(-)